MQGERDFRFDLSGNISKAPAKVDFPNLIHFIEDVREAGVKTVRLDAFEFVSQSELSFVYHVTLALFVTAHDPIENVFYEYTEALGTQTNTEPEFTDSSLTDLVERRTSEVKEELRQANFNVRHGRYTIPDSPQY
jgi:hypothetical protein